jgi:hypothetical protein
VTCPHCLTEDHGTSHFTSEKAATDTGRTLCLRPGRRLARGQYWGWACPSDHTCHAGRLPPVPAPDLSEQP